MNLTYVLEVQNFYLYVVIKPYTHMEYFVKACDFNLHIFETCGCQPDYMGQ